MIRNLILDWSGTLVDDFSATLVATNEVFAHYGLPAMSASEFRRDFRLPYPEFYAEFLPGVPLAELEVLFKEAFLKAENLVQPLPATRGFLEAASEKSLRLFVLSSMNEEALRRQARDFAIQSYFEEIYAGVLNKCDRIGSVVAEHGLLPEETAYVGDMVHDVHAAQAGGLHSVALLSGYDPVERLAAAGPQMILPDIGQLPKLCATGAPARVRPDIVVRKLRVAVHIGVPEEERAQAQELKISLTLETRSGLNGLGDDLARTVDYFALTEAVKALAQDRPRKLIETLAEEVALFLLAKFPLRAVRVEIEKAILLNCEGVVVSCQRRSAQK
ncbi:dihydroneopterin aldolase [Roseibacillus ishigakijimensis]|uniref:phosphoglycolate phosphatase n=1 Tax=Roseibacillus ishigakijimensis TaxID=454146 RepID=A0A934RPV6_9BACT|nr:dihydroneopterin aldolase [Roseibacillus ishigakijimensis]MBK1833396.1 dihydroneopterin aldolase [Roseibacillus ishigakijimensis]